MYSNVEMSPTGEISAIFLEFNLLVVNQSDCEKKYQSPFTGLVLCHSPSRTDELPCCNGMSSYLGYLTMKIIARKSKNFQAPSTRGLRNLKTELYFSRHPQKSVNCRFSYDVTKIKTTKLLILLIFYFNEV